MRTTLNAEMLVIVGPMGRDVAAFTDPLDAFEYVEVLKAATRDRMSFRRPDGATLTFRGSKRIEGQGFLDWATTWQGAEEA
jgi:hypothetical protein